jgi:hypothetical protein
MTYRWWGGVHERRNVMQKQLEVLSPAAAVSGC